MTKQILVVDGNAPWVRALFLEMGADVEVTFLRIYHVGTVLRGGGRRIRNMFAAQRIAENARELTIPTVGWSKFPNRTCSIIASRCRGLARQFGAPTWVVYTLPFYAMVVEQMRHVPSIYYAHDPFQFYDWASPATAEQELRLLERCTLVAAVSQQMLEDFQPVARGKAFLSRNATSLEFARRMAGPRPPRPRELGDGGKAIVGCVGQIDRSYDVDLIECLAKALPDADLVFVGPIIEPQIEHARNIERVFGLPNIRWLGPRPHEALPNYLAHFDVCLNPLKVNEHANRRSPLKLYDYITTDKPVLSTAIREALVHQPHVRVAYSMKDAVELARRMVRGEIVADVVARRNYIARNTWRARAEEFRERIGL